LAVDEFKNVISSKKPFTWTFFEEPNGAVRIKSEEDNLYLQLDKTNVVLAQDARSKNVYSIINDLQPSYVR
jgi:hypothetical protein